MICDMTFKNLQLNCMTIVLEDLIMEATQDMNIDTFYLKQEFSKVSICVSDCRDFCVYYDLAARGVNLGGEPGHPHKTSAQKVQVELCIILHLPDPLLSNGKNCEIDLRSISSIHKKLLNSSSEEVECRQGRKDLLC